MPGRVSRGAGRSSETTTRRKPRSLAVRSRNSAQAVEVPDEGPVTFLRTQICQAFSEAQKSTGVQRKLVITLRKIQKACCYGPQNPKQRIRQLEEFGEEDFNDEVGRCVLRILGVKKSEPVGDRVVRFLGAFLQRANEEDNAQLQDEDNETSSLLDTASSRLTTYIVNLLLNVITAKDKVVRFRANQMISVVIQSAGHIDSDLYDLIKLSLSRRLRDKEASVRQHAVLGFGFLATPDGDDEDDDSDDESPADSLEKLLDLLKHDSSADVRRAVLMNMLIIPRTLKGVLERARDVDTVTRRAFYSKVMPMLGDFRNHSPIEREKLIRWGLRDRDELVRKATARLFRERWLETCASSALGKSADDMKPGEVLPPSMDALKELLERMDVTNRTGVEGGMAHDAMAAFWEGRPDYREYVTFDDDFWNDLRSEGAFIARSFNDYCIASKDDRLLEQKMPEVRKIAFFISKYLNDLIHARKQIAEMDDLTQEDEEAYNELEFTAEQLLHIALTLDYSDEVGRRQVFNLMREALSRPELPEECTTLAAQVLRRACSEKEFISVMKEALDEVKVTAQDADFDEEGEDDDEEDSFHSAQSDLSDLDSDAAQARKKKKKKTVEDVEKDEDEEHNELLIYAKCMHLAECLLQNIDCELESNNVLVDLLNNIIVPALRYHNDMIRQMTIKCLGLCTLRSKNLAISNLGLFIHCAIQGTIEVRTISIHSLADMLCAHKTILSPTHPTASDMKTEDPDEPQPSEFIRPFTKCFTQCLRSKNTLLSQNTCLAICKLLLHDVLSEETAADFVRQLMILFYDPDPETGEGPVERKRYRDTVKQILTYCLPAWCHVRLSNAKLMAGLAVPLLQKLVMMKEELDEVEQGDEMATWANITAQIAEWTDPRKAWINNVPPRDGAALPPPAEDPHVHLAIAILERALGASSSKEEKKPLLMLLGKLNVASPMVFLAGDAKTPTIKSEEDMGMLRELHELAAEGVEAKLGPDARSRESIAKVEMVVGKKLGEKDENEDSELTIKPSERASETSAVVEPSEVDVAEEAEQTEQEGDGVQATVQAGEQEDEEEEDTMLAGIHAEGTRMPLEEEDEDEDEDTMTDVTAVRTNARRSKSRATVTEDDIVDSLLESEME